MPTLSPALVQKLPGGRFAHWAMTCRLCSRCCRIVDTSWFSSKKGMSAAQELEARHGYKAWLHPVERFRDPVPLWSWF
jgi:hypothetical protein